MKVLVEGGRNQDSNINRLYGYRDRMPVFALAYLHDALVAQGRSAAHAGALAELRRRMSNAILPEAGSAHVEELSDPYLLWFWNSNVRSTAIVLNSWCSAGAAETEIAADGALDDGGAERTAAGATRRRTRYAMERSSPTTASTRATVPDFRRRRHARRRGARARAVQGADHRRRRTKDVPMAQVLAKAPRRDDAAADVRARRRRHAVLHGALRYAADALFQQGLDSGFRIERVVRAVRRERRRRPAATTLQGRRPRPGHADVRADEGAALRRGHRSAARGLRAGRVVVRDDGARRSAREQDDQGDAETTGQSWWQRGGFDHVERHDDRVQLFATRLSEGRHEFTYIVRATTAGTFRTAPARAEEMYEPEVFGRTATSVIEVEVRGASRRTARFACES